ncbi:unnamed protein product [marine sediment metagenome]|uniref:Amidohydrolase-related domain-containing protein n=1 Tax=marine sediment metagenome TaxID=412755 RepID=X1VPB3_9ZZZZ
MKSWKMERRDFLRYAEAGAMGAALSTGKLSGGVQKTRSETAEYGEIMPEVRKYRKIDSHNHINKDTDLAKFIETADRLEIEWLAVSRPDGQKFVKPHEVRDLNDIILNGIYLASGTELTTVAISLMLNSLLIPIQDRCLISIKRIAKDTGIARSLAIFTSSIQEGSESS